MSNKETELNQTSELTRLMLQREKASLEKEEKQRVHIEGRDALRIKQDKEMQETEQRRIKFCDHRKGTGGTGGSVRNPVVDYNLFVHTFINQVTVVRCNKCSGEWAQGTTKETLVHYDGRTEPNFTGKSFEEMLALAMDSTNQPSRAEVPFNILSPTVVPKAATIAKE